MVCPDEEGLFGSLKPMNPISAGEKGAWVEFLVNGKVLGLDGHLHVIGIHFHNKLACGFRHLEDEYLPE